MSDKNVSVSVNERRIGKAAGKAAGREISQQMTEVKTKLESMEREVRKTNKQVEDLERRITDIERTKARAQRQATEDLKENLHEQYQEKKEEYRYRLANVLDDYRGSIARLKDRFLNSISDEGEQFDQVTGEFDEVRARREAAVEGAAALGDAATATHERRVRRVIGARNEFLSVIDEFLEDRQETAETIRSLQTPIPGVSGEATVRMPFWVVGIERNGTEELHVFPVLDRGEPAGSPTRATPYADYLQPHPTHGFQDMVDAVREYVVRDEVRDALAERDGPFADPSFLRDSSAVRDRFVDTLVEYEFRDKRTTRGDTSPGGGENRQTDAGVDAAADPGEEVATGD